MNAGLRWLLITSATGIIIAAVGFLSLQVRRHPHRSKADPNRVRLPRVVLVAGILFVLVGLVSVTAWEKVEDRVPFAIFLVAIILTGIWFIVWYARWFIDVRADHLTIRTTFRGERTIWYEDIVRYDFSTHYNVPTLSVTAKDGTRFGVNYRTFDVDPLLAAIGYHQQTGYWPPSAPRPQGPVWH